MSKETTRNKRNLIVIQPRFDTARKAINAAMQIVDWAPNVGILIGESGKQVCCPFHDDSTPSFSVDYERNIFNCFGCSTSGSFVEFYIAYQKRYHERLLSKAAAIEELLASSEELRASLGYSTIYRSFEETTIEHDETGRYIWEKPKRLDGTRQTVGMKHVLRKLRKAPVEVIMEFVADCQEGADYRALVDKYFYEKATTPIPIRREMPADIMQSFLAALESDDED